MHKAWYAVIPPRISIPEFESIDIVSDLVSQDRRISKEHADLIELYQERSGQTFFNVSRKKLTATSWVGSFIIGNLCIEVVPKIDTEDSRGMANLVYMLWLGGLIKGKAADISWLAKSDSPLITAFLELYVQNLRDEWFNGPVRSYVSMEANRFFLKGKIVFSQHLRENAFHKERFFTDSDEFTVDNRIARLLKAALNVCHKHPLTPLASVQVKTLLCLFDEVSDEHINTNDFRSICVDRTTSRFEYLINMAKIIVENVSPWQTISGVPVYSIMFDMNVVFEKFVCEELKRAAKGSDYEIISQSADKCLARRDDQKHLLLGKPVFRLKPDISVFDTMSRPKCLKCLLDTKWKKLGTSKNKEPEPKKFWASEDREPVSQSDMYQMYAYAHIYKCPVILIYPHHSGVGQQTQPPACSLLKYRFAEEPYIIIVCTVDITIDLGRAVERKRLREHLLKLLQDIG